MELIGAPVYQKFCVQMQNLKCLKTHNNNKYETEHTKMIEEGDDKTKQKA